MAESVSNPLFEESTNRVISSFEAEPPASRSEDFRHLSEGRRE